MSTLAKRLASPAGEPVTTKASMPPTTGVSVWTRMVLRFLNAGLTPEDLEKMSPEEINMRLWHSPQPPD